MTTSFFNGAFFGGEFFNTPSADSSVPTPAGKSSKKKKRKVIIGERLYEVDSLADIEFLLKRLVREDPAPVTRAAKARVRVVDRVSAKLGDVAPEAIPIAPEVDWSALWMQLALQDRTYADALERALAKQEEEDIEILLLH